MCHLQGHHPKDNSGHLRLKHVPKKSRKGSCRVKHSHAVKEGLMAPNKSCTSITWRTTLPGPCKGSTIGMVLCTCSSVFVPQCMSKRQQLTKKHSCTGSREHTRDQVHSTAPGPCTRSCLHAITFWGLPLMVLGCRSDNDTETWRKAWRFRC
jgi:hypothetical protein